MGKLESAGFSSEPQNNETKSLVVCTIGHPKRGKTTWALTAPHPIAVVGLDTGTEERVDEARALGKTVYASYHELPERDSGNPKSEYQKIWEDVSTQIWAALREPSVRTLIVDTATELYALLRLAEFGRLASVPSHLYPKIYAKLRAMFAASKRRVDLNAVWINKVKKEYAAETKKKPDGTEVTESSWTGNWEMDGWRQIWYDADVVLEHLVAEPRTRFGIKILESRHNLAEVRNKSYWDDEADFAALAMTLLPDSDPDNWESN